MDGNGKTAAWTALPPLLLPGKAIQRHALLLALAILLAAGFLWAGQPARNEIALNIPVAGGPLVYLGALQPASGLAAPLAVAVLPDGRVLAAEGQAGRVSVLDREGQYISSWGGFSYPNALAAAPRGQVYIAELNARRVRLVDGHGRTVRMIDAGATGSPFAPLALALDGEGSLYIADRAGRVLVLDGKGKLLRTVGAPGREAGNLSYPNGLALDGTGNLYVSDSGNVRLQVFDPAGRLLRVLPGEAAGVSMPRGLAVDAAGRIFVADVLRYRVAVLDQAGKKLVELGARQGGAALRYPGGLALDGRGRLLVADRRNGRVAIFGPAEGEGHAAER